MFHQIMHLILDRTINHFMNQIKSMHPLVYMYQKDSVSHNHLKEIPIYPTCKHCRKRSMPFLSMNLSQLTGVSSVTFHIALHAISITSSHWPMSSLWLMMSIIVCKYQCKKCAINKIMHSCFAGKSHNAFIRRHNALTCILTL